MFYIIVQVSRFEILQGPALGSLCILCLEYEQGKRTAWAVHDLSILITMDSYSNTAVDPSDRNTEYFDIEISDSHSYIQPYDWELSTKSWKCCGFPKQIFLKTTKPVQAGSEVLVGYGRNYYIRHDL